MLIIELAPLENGGHNNQWSDSPMLVPSGWAVVPEGLEEEAKGYLPYIVLTVEGGQITGVAQSAITPPLPPPPPNTHEFLLGFMGVTDDD